MRVVPRAQAAATARMGYSSIIDGAPLGRHLDAAAVRRRDAQVGHRLAAHFAGVLGVMSAPISRRVS